LAPILCSVPILGDPIHIHDELADPIRATATGAPILLTLEDLENLGGYVAAKVNHSKDKKVRKKLDAIFSKIQDLLETHSDEESPRSLNFEDAQRQKLIANQCVELAEWAATMLIGAEQLGIKDKPVTQFPLPWTERALLLVSTSADKTILKKLETEKPSVTIAEVGGLLMAVAEALLDAPQLQSKALLVTAKCLMDCLEAEVTPRLE
jgi:hypothetical protein